ncbi:LacI family DNA-binding transcriptional regulator [Rhizobium sullae]|uniref:LacI family transcriptional regulator n=1 Tax=Rhizobium sullae TaxID=50338 RepID=A0A4R3PZC9_RHISU|nr:LacI family DNA-binding transcriptional regulator [Rhizobium sullae]TCU13434.1 LacI family transcriptional regulator [Rhizobium sullae]
MNDVAKAADVSVATVSAVVNGTVPVSQKLKGRVEEAIRSIGYQRNVIARNLKVGSTRTIGLVVADVTNPFFTDVVAVIQDVLHRAGFAIMLCSSDEDMALQDEQVSLLLERMVDGLIIAPTGDDAELKRILAKTRIPVVLIDRMCEGMEVDAVTLDNRAAVREAITYILSLGHNPIGYISGSLDTSTGRDRLSGYKAALEEAQIPFDPTVVKVGHFREKDAYGATFALLAGQRRPTAIFSANNLMTIGVMKAIRDLGLRCPEDVSVASLDDFAWADVFQPYLTTIAQPVQAIGEQAARLVLERAKGETGKAHHIVLQGRLIVRNSCRPVMDRAVSSLASGSS